MANPTTVYDVSSGAPNNGFNDTANSLPTATNSISGRVYAFNCSGNGFATSQSFDTIHRMTQTILAQYDVTGAIEILMDVRVFNAKLGITKDASNVGITNSNPYAFYDNCLNIFKQNYFSITTSDLQSNVNAANPIATPTSALPSLMTGINRIVTVGRFSSLYSDFAAYVASYFGFQTSTTSLSKSGFNTLFTNDEDFNPNMGLFDASALIKLITGSPTLTDGSGATLTALTGTIDISNVTQLLANAVDSNCFGNRNPLTGTTSSYVDASGNRRNYGITDGFYADDLFFIPSAGFTVTLQVALDQELYTTPLNNVGLNYDAATGTTTDASGNFILNASAGIFTSTSTSTAILISRKVTAPVLIRLANLSTV